MIAQAGLMVCVALKVPPDSLMDGSVFVLIEKFQWANTARETQPLKPFGYWQIKEVNELYSN